jgi:hypothetical protein
MTLMAGDWLAACKDLPDKPEVIAIANATGLVAEAVASFLLFRFWAWADSQTDTGFVAHVSRNNLITMFNQPEILWRTMEKVGWLVVCSDGIELPNFARWMGESAKRRLQNSARQRELRKRKRDNEDDNHANKPSRKRRDKSATTGQDSTGENKSASHSSPPIPPELDTDQFRRAWGEWLTYRSGRRLSCRPETLQKQLAFLAALGSATPAIACIDQSIRNGWQGLFPVDDKKHSNTKGQNGARDNPFRWKAGADYPG